MGQLERQRKYRKRHAERLRIEARLRARKIRADKRKLLRMYELRRANRLANPQRARLYNRDYRNRDREKTLLIGRVQQMVRRAVRSGKLRKPMKCDWCRKRCIPQAHHENYLKPLEVVWLCSMCHIRHHKLIRDGG
jgi:hypothetical protein